MFFEKFRITLFRFKLGLYLTFSNKNFALKPGLFIFVFGNVMSTGVLSNEINDIESLNANHLFLVATPKGLNIFDSKSNEFIKDVLFNNQKVVDVAKVDSQSFLVLTETSLNKLSFLPNGSFNKIEIL